MIGAQDTRLAVKPLTQADRARWDAFVTATPSGTFCHRAGWQRVIERAFRHKTHFVYAERGGEITGVLPLTEICSRLFGHSLVSNAFQVYGGPVATDEASRDALVGYATDLLAQTKADHLEFRSVDAEMPGWLVKDGLYATFRCEISADHQANLTTIPRKQRAVVRKGIANQLSTRVGHDWRTLHRVYGESVRNLGTPVFSRKYFALLCEEFGDDAEILVVEDQETPIAAVLSFYFRDQVLPYYGGGTPAARARAGNDVMYWEVMRRAADRGCRIFDFGRSKIDTGAYSFKKNWGFTPTPLNYEFKLRVGDTIPDVNPLNPKYRLMIETWKRLPLPVANLLGPTLVRNLG
ncbi:MAG: FemAB family system-associated protein [Rhodospirillales bacterium]|nr:FemAB family system-associated protein [Rhodospirillales bacterium]